MKPVGFLALLSSFVIANYCALVSSVPINQNESENREMVNDFQLTELCEDLKNDEKKKDTCGKCFRDISDVEDKSSLAKCMPNLSKKTAECVKKMFESSDEMNLEKCRQGNSKETESLMAEASEQTEEQKEDTNESSEESKENKEQEDRIEEDKLPGEGEILNDTEMKSRMVEEFWLNYGTSLALKSMLKLVEENDEKQFLQIYSIIKPCKNVTMATNSSINTSIAEAVETKSEQVMKSQEAKDNNAKSNITTPANGKNQQKKKDNEKKDKQHKRETEETSKPEINDEICDLTHLIPELTKCILSALVENKEILTSIKPLLVNGTTPIPAEIVKILLETIPPCEQS